MSKIFKMPPMVTILPSTVVNRDTTHCKSCGVVLCSYNWTITYCKRYVSRECRHCQKGISSCRLPLPEGWTAKDMRRHVANTYAKTARSKATRKKAGKKYRAKPGYRDKANAYLREYRKKNKTKVAAWQKAWRESNLDADKQCKKSWKESWKKSNPEAYKQSTRKSNRDMRERMTDAYIRTLIKGKNSIITSEDIPQELIDLKRKQLKLYRDVQSNKDSHRK